MIVYNSTLDRIYQYLLIGAFFFLPITVIGNNIAIWSIVLIWLFSGNYAEKFYQIKSNKFAIVSILFFMMHIFGLLWTENISWGLEISRKMLPFLLVLPIFLTITKIQNIKFYILAFLVAISFSEFLSYLIWFGIIEPFGSATLTNPTPLMSHISYNPFLAFAIYLVVFFLFSKKGLTLYERASYTFFTLTMTINMFITGGRAGQVMFFVFLILIAFQFFRNSQVKAVLISLVFSIFISVLAYNSSPLFKSRINAGITDIVNYQNSNPSNASSLKNSSIGLRIAFFVNSYDIFKESPYLGVGTGDFPTEYGKINDKNTPGLTSTVQPHNMYMLILVQLGLIGLIIFLLLFYIQLKIAYSSSSYVIRNVGVAIPILFLVIMWSDSYLLGHFTGNLFILFSSVIYSVQDKN
jgi:O-antigen ligase